ATDLRPALFDRVRLRKTRICRKHEGERPGGVVVFTSPLNEIGKLRLVACDSRQQVRRRARRTEAKTTIRQPDLARIRQRGDRLLKTIARKAVALVGVAQQGTDACPQHVNRSVEAMRGR